jgi:hypothetical protein
MTSVMVDVEVEEAVPRPTARLGRYAIWQLRDYALGVGGATLLLSGMAIVVLTMSSIGDSGGGAAGLQRNVTTGVIGILSFLGPIFAASGLVADDRSKGYYRFTLAKPVSPVRLYGQAFLLRGATLLGIAAIVWLLSTVLLSTGPFLGTMAYVALCYLTVGGVTLLLSTVTRHAWIATLFLGAASAITRGLAGVPHTWWIVKALHAVLPPLDLVGAIGARLMNGSFLAPGMILWFAGYGVLAIAGALTVIRRREWPL